MANVDKSFFAQSFDKHSNILRKTSQKKSILVISKTQPKKETQIKVKNCSKYLFNTIYLLKN